MKIKVKIGDFVSVVRMSGNNARLVNKGGNISLPAKFSITSDSSEEIKYGFRLLHLHSRNQAEEILKRLPSEIIKEVKIIPVGRNWGSASIERFWIIRQAFKEITSLNSWKNRTLKRLDDALRRRVEIEGGVYKIFPESPASDVILADDSGCEIARMKRITIASRDGIKVSDVPVGETFHWEHKENLIFNGELIIQGGENGILVVNEIDIEDYLASVNSSEMSSKAHPEFLKAQTIAARATVLATMGCHHYGEPFDLCNSDHCQCYYGSGRVENRSLEASRATEGQFLFWDGKVADTRYAKTCGGITEKFNQVWEQYDPAYLPKFFDGGDKLIDYSDWNEYIDSKPDCYCNPEIYPYPDFFDYARPWFRWEISFTNERLSEIIRERTGRDIGRIKDIIPAERGESGRITRITIVGDDELEINGELNIRRALSDSHLPSSCFIVQIDGEDIIFKGAGWGHGVGLCQMGALAMAGLGFDFKEILGHYYPGVEIVNIGDFIK